MEFLVILLIALCVYFWMQNNSLRDQNSKERYKNKGKTIQRYIDYDANKSSDIKDSEVSYGSQSTSNTPISSGSPRSQSTSNTPISSGTPRRQNSALPTLNTDIPGLGGPGVYHRLFLYGLQGEALYLLYSKSHQAFKIGHSRPNDLEQRIKRIMPEVPDIELAGLSVFTSAQRAHDREQKILELYADKKYRGIIGRYSGRTEWLTVRPSRPKSIKSIEKIEEEFKKDQNSSVEKVQVQDLYTVYLMYSPSRGMYYCSWCNTNNVEQKERIQQRDFSSDANIISRMPFDSLQKARASCNEFNRLTNSYKRQGRRELREWTERTDFLNNFRNWDKNGNRI